jgi:hypothetical protein
MSFSIILLFPTSFIGGISYYPADEKHIYKELNIYLLILQLQFRWE